MRILNFFMHCCTILFVKCSFLDIYNFHCNCENWWKNRSSWQKQEYFGHWLNPYKMQKMIRVQWRHEKKRVHRITNKLWKAQLMLNCLFSEIMFKDWVSTVTNTQTQQAIILETEIQNLEVTVMYMLQLPITPHRSNVFAHTLNKEDLWAKGRIGIEECHLRINDLDISEERNHRDK
jgi:hypothetical protein